MPTETALAPASTSSKASRPVRDPAHAEDRHLGQRGVHLPDAAHRDRLDRRPGQPAGDAGEHRAHRVEVDGHAEQRVDHRQAVGAGVDAGPGDRDDVGDVGRQLGAAPAPTGAVCRRTAPTTAAAASGSQANTRPRFSTFGQEMLTSTATHARGAAQPAGQLGVLLDAAAGDRHDGAGAVLVQPGQVVLEEGVDARALQADRVEHAARRLGHPRRRPGRTAARSMIDLVTTAPSVGDVEELRRARGRRPRSRTRSAPGWAAATSPSRAVRSTCGALGPAAARPVRT